MAAITITHAHADGTLVSGSSKGDGAWEALRDLRDNWRPFRSLGCLGLGLSRDKRANTYKINRAAEALRAAGHEVTVEIDDAARPFAEVEAGRYGRAEERADRMAGHAGNAADRSNAAYERAHQMAEAIPFGQPKMPDHHSYGRDVRYRDRIHSLHGKSIEEGRKADHFAHRADSAANEQAHRENIPATLRRIERLEADERRTARQVAGDLMWATGDDGKPHLRLVKPEGEHLQRLEASVADLREQIAYWRNHVAAAQENGVKVWTRADFARGDFALCRGQWLEIQRVNAKTLGVPWGVNFVHLNVMTAANARDALGGSGHTGKITYDAVRGRKSAADMAAALESGEITERREIKASH